MKIRSQTILCKNSWLFASKEMDAKVTELARQCLPMSLYHFIKSLCHNVKL